MLAPEELADLRGVAVDSLPDTCTVSRIQRVRQPNGSWKDVEVVVGGYVDIPCRKVPSGQTPQEQALMDSISSTSDGIATFLLEATRQIFKDDILLHKGTRYPVAGVHDRSEQIYTRAIVYDKSKAPA